MIRVRKADDARVRKAGLERLRYSLALHVERSVATSRSVRKRINGQNGRRDLRVALHAVEDRLHQRRQRLLRGLRDGIEPRRVESVRVTRVEINQAGNLVGVSRAHGAQLFTAQRMADEHRLLDR